MTLNEIKELAYHECTVKDLSITDAYLYDRETAIYKLFKLGIIDAQNAKERITAAENDYRALCLLNNCFSEMMELHRISEHLKCEYNETHSDETAHKIAKLLTAETVNTEVQNG